MTYNGEVTVGGPAQFRLLPQLSIGKVAVGPMSNNAYLLECRETGEQLLIDAAAEPETLLGFVDTERLQTIVTTHWHPDHWEALADVADATSPITIAGEPDVEHIPTPTQRSVWTGDTVTVGSVELEVIGLVGHTPGSIALYYTDPEGHGHLWTGDSLFPGGVGKTWSPEDFASLYHDVTTKLFDRFDDDTWFYPGHGNDSTLGAERPHLSEWQQRGW